MNGIAQFGRGVKLMPKHDYSQYLVEYKAGTPSAELAKRAGMNPGQMYRGLRAAGAVMRDKSQAGKGRTMPSGNASASFKGGTFIDKDGYVRVRGEGRNRLEHRLVIESALGRPLTKTEVVHHINGVKTDNRAENLLVCSASQHREIHASQDAKAKCGHADWRMCIYCHQYDDQANLSVVKKNQSCYHKACAATYQQNRNKRSSTKEKSNV